MKYILFLLVFISSAAMSQGITTLIFVPGTGWVQKKLVDSAWTATQFATVNGNISTLNTTVQNASQGTVADGSITNLKLAGSITANKLVGSDITLAESQITNLTGDLALKAPLANPTFSGTVTLPNLSVTNAMLAGSIPYSKLSLTGAILNADLAGSIAASKLVGSDITLTESQTTNLVTDLGNKQGMSSAATSSTTGTMTTTMTSATQNIFTITPTGACTFNASGGKSGARMTFVVTTSGITSFTLTWGTNFKPVSTLATGTTTAKVFTVDFICLADNITWVETGRTAAH